MPDNEVDAAVRDLVASSYGNTSDLREQLVNTLTNLCYFAVKAQGSQFGGLTDLQTIHPTKKKQELVPLYMKHVQHVSMAAEMAPELIEKLRETRNEGDVFDVFEQVAIDLLKFDIEHAERKTEDQRAAERSLRAPNEFPDLARRLRVPFRKPQSTRAAEIPRDSVTLSPGETTPAMDGGTPVCSYEAKECRAVLCQNPRSLNPMMRYPHALIVYPPGHDEPPMMYIVAEQSHVTAGALATLPREMQAIVKQYAGKDIFLTVYSGKGKANLGSAPEYATLAGFETKALDVMRRTLGVKSELKVLNDTRAGGSFGKSGCMGVIVGGFGLGLFGYGAWQVFF